MQTLRTFLLWAGCVDLAFFAMTIWLAAYTSKLSVSQVFQHDPVATIGCAVGASMIVMATWIRRDQ